MLLGGGIYSSLACSTLPHVQDVQLPAYASQYFSDCRQSEGGVTISVVEKGLNIDKVEADWAAQNNGDWTLASYSPIGQTLLQVSYIGEPLTIQTMGQQSSALGEVGLEGKGFLSIQDKRIGMKADEVACFLDLKLPRRWLQHVVEQSSDREALHLGIDDGTRYISLRLARYGQKLAWNWQANIRWSLYWGLAHGSMELQLMKDSGLVLSSENFPDTSYQVSTREE